MSLKGQGMQMLERWAMRAPTAAAIILVSALCAAQTNEELAIAEYRERIRFVTEGALEKNLREIATFGSRLSGSAGERKALEWAESRFRTLGLENVRQEPFKVAVPDPDAVASVAGNGWKVEAFPLWPNLVRTSTCDFTGNLVYGGRGTLEELSGHLIEGAAVVLEYEAGANWRNAAKLGAKAVLFLEPSDGSRFEAEAMFSGSPSGVPRFWVPLKTAGPLLRAAFRKEKARIACKQPWVERETFNVLADVPGTDSQSSNERLLVAAYADSMCVVPRLAYGAETSTGLAALTELARIARARPGKRPVTFMAMGAHCLALQGAREFIQRRLSSDQAPFLFCMTLDLTTGSPTLGSFAQGWFFEYRQEAFEMVRSISRVLRAHVDRIAPLLDVPQPRMVLTDATNDGDGRPWKNNIPGKFAFDCELFLQARYNALTFATIEDARSKIDTPFDTLEKLSLPNLATQVRTLACLLWHVQNDTSARGDVSSFRVPLEVRRPERMSLVGGFATVEGRVVQFDPLKSFIPDIVVPGAVAVSLHNQRTLMGVRGPMMQLVGMDGRYRFVGCPPISSWFRVDQRPMRVAAFRLNPESGLVDYAPSRGTLGRWLYDPEFLLTTAERSIPLVVFPCVSTDLYDLSDPQELRSLGVFRMIDALTGAEPNYYSFFLPGQDIRLNSEIEDSAVLFTPPAFRWKLLMGTMLGENRLVLTNADPAHPEGRGFASAGTQKKDLIGRDASASSGTFSFLTLQAAKDIAILNRSRLNQFGKYKIISPSVEALEKEAELLIGRADKAIEKRDWASAERYSRSAWGYALRAHPAIQGTANDVVNGVIFYLILLIPFSYFLEKLIFASRSLSRQLAIGTAIFLGSFAVLRAIHPAFEIVSNPTMIFVGFVLGALSVIVIGFIIGRFESSLRAMRAIRRGIHEVDIGRFSVALAAFNLGIGNMRRRKVRTIFTTATLVVMTFIALSFTSIVSELKILEVPGGQSARYAGILVRDPGQEPLQNVTYRILSNQFAGQATVVRRAWYFGADNAGIGAVTLKRAARIVDARALFGLEPGEKCVTRANEALLPGGRWFKPGDERVAILPRSMATQLRIDSSDVGKAQFEMAGESYTVIGIVDDSILKSVNDLDGDGILPADFGLSSAFQSESRTSSNAFRKFLRLDPGVCVLLPLEQALRLGASIRSVAVGFESPQQAREALDKLMPRVRLNLYAGVQGPSGLELKMFSVQQGQKSTGLALVLVQMLIASVFVLNTMVASVYERRREIGIFSAVGLAPNHIAVLFFAESLVYGVLGAVIGYFLAQGAARGIIATGALPGLYLNFSATSAVLSAGVVMAVVLLSTIYPARIAARIAAPALDEELMHTDPEGDTWEIPLPFSLSREEMQSLIGFLAKWLQAYEEYTIGDFVTSGTSAKSRSLFSRGENEEGVGGWRLESTVWPAPYDLGVSQRLNLESQETDLPDVFRLDLTLERLSGDPASWVLVNKRFLEHLRKQFLTWRSLEATERARYQPGPAAIA